MGPTPALDVVCDEQPILSTKTDEMISIILIEDHTIVREGLKMILSQFGNICLLGDAASGADGVRLFERLMRQGQQVDVVVSDLGLPDFSGIEVTRQIKTVSPETRVLILSMHANQEHIAGLLEIGIDGYLLKQSSPAELAEGIRAVALGGMALSPVVARGLVNQMKRQVQRQQAVQSLTEREQQVLALLANGETSKEIARGLQLSIKTIENHRSRILEKLDVANTAAAIGRAYQLGLIAEQIV